MKLTHIRLLVEDMQTCYKFYKDTLGLEEHIAAENLVYVEFKAGDILLALYRKDLMDEALETTSQASSDKVQDKVVLTFDVPDVDKLFEDLSAKGVQFVNEPHDQTVWFLRVAHLRDPEGNLIEINAPLQSEPAA